MNVWLLATIGLVLCMGPCALVCVKASPGDRLVALELAGTVTTLSLLCLAQAAERAVYLDLAVSLALLSFAGGIVFAHFMERWV
jgi:multisubunit Na+/H+ antiporter MnhF subunit